MDRGIHLWIPRIRNSIDSVARCVPFYKKINGECRTNESGIQYLPQRRACLDGGIIITSTSDPLFIYLGKRSIHSVDFVVGIQPARSVSRFFAIFRILASSDKNIASRDVPMSDNADFSRYLTLYRAIIPWNIVSWLHPPRQTALRNHHRGFLSGVLRECRQDFYSFEGNANANCPLRFSVTARSLHCKGKRILVFREKLQIVEPWFFFILLFRALISIDKYCMWGLIWKTGRIASRLSVRFFGKSAENQWCARFTLVDSRDILSSNHDIFSLISNILASFLEIICFRKVLSAKYRIVILKSWFWICS